MANLYKKRGLFDEAAPLWEEIVRALERVRGYDHPEVASALNSWAELLGAQVRVVRLFWGVPCGRGKTGHEVRVVSRGGHVVAKTNMRAC